MKFTFWSPYFFFIILLWIFSYFLLSGRSFCVCLAVRSSLSSSYFVLSRFLIFFPFLQPVYHFSKKTPSIPLHHRSSRSHVSISFTAPEWFSSSFPCLLFLFHSATSYHFYLLVHFLSFHVLFSLWSECNQHATNFRSSVCLIIFHSLIRYETWHQLYHRDSRQIDATETAEGWQACCQQAALTERSIHTAMTGS